MPPPIPPPMPWWSWPSPPPSSSAFGISTTSESVVRSRADTLAAFCRAVRTTLAGSITPALTRSQYSALSASQPSFLPFMRRTRLTTTEPSTPALAAIASRGYRRACFTIDAPIFSSASSSPLAIRFSIAFSLRSRATPPPGTMPSARAACTALFASSMSAFRSFISVSVAAPTLICATPPAIFASRSCSFSRS